jgi:hypothetical protein
MDAGFAALTAQPDGVVEEIIFDTEDWRFELGAWAKQSRPLKFDPVVCGFDPASMGFVPGWAGNPR